MYFKGIVVHTNYQTAQEWFTQGAAQGAPEAKANLALMEGKKKDELAQVADLLKLEFHYITSQEIERFVALYENPPLSKGAVEEEEEL